MEGLVVILAELSQIEARVPGHAGKRPGETLGRNSAEPILLIEAMSRNEPLGRAEIDLTRALTYG